MNDHEINCENHKFYRNRVFSIYNPTAILDGLSYEDKEIILKHGEWLKALADEIIKPYTEQQEKFVKVCVGEEPPSTKFEIAWKNYIWINNFLSHESTEWKNFKWEPGLSLNDLNSNDRGIIIKYGRFLKALEITILKPCNQAQEQFLKVCRGLVDPHTEYELAWVSFIDAEKNQPKKQKSEQVRENAELREKLSAVRKENISLLTSIDADKDKNEEVEYDFEQKIKTLKSQRMIFFRSLSYDELKNNWWDKRTELDLDQEEKSMIRDILREELHVSVHTHRKYTINDFTTNKIYDR